MIEASPRGVFSEARPAMSFILAYINEALEELHKVRWPTRQQAIRLSIIVLSFTVAAALIFGVVDLLLQSIVKTVLNLIPS